MRVTAGALLSGRSGRGGRDTRGMIRQHQFRKVELVSISSPSGRNEHERMTACAEEV